MPNVFWMPWGLKGNQRQKVQIMAMLRLVRYGFDRLFYISCSCTIWPNTKAQSKTC